jgi:hypothetical protein
MEVPAGFSPATELKAKWEKHLEGRVSVHPWTTTRLSGIGDVCERRIFYRRTEGHREKPYDIGLQAIFDLGNHLEPYAVRKLEDMGFTVRQRGRDWADLDLDMTGHVDLLLAHEKWPFDVVTEVKGLNEFTAGTIETLDDIRNNASPWVRKYFSQLQGYLYIEQKPMGLFALLGKSSGNFTFVDCPRDEAFIEEHIVKKARRIKAAVAAREPLARTLIANECVRCGFKHLCCPDVTYGEQPVVIENPPQDLLEALETREELEQSKKLWERADKLVKSMLPDAPNVIVGGYQIDGKKAHRGAYSVAATEYWTRKVKRIGGAA